MKRKNYFMIVALLLIVGIGYAALSSNLGIRGLGSYKSNTWDVYLDNLIDNSAYSEVVSQASINEDKDSISFQVNLDDFEDKYIFYTDVVNNGTIDAMIDNLEVTGLSNEVKKFIDIKVTYKDGIAVNRYDLLKENSRDTLKVECSYKENIDITDLPDTDGSTSLTITIDYVLADVNAREREHGEGDENAPVITLANTDIKQGINGWVNRADFTYKIEDKDAVKSVKYCVSTEECSPNIEATLQDNEFNYSFGTSNQSQLICVEAVDIFGNTTKECSDSYLVDVDEPEITNMNATTENNTIRVEVTASDSISGVSKYYYSKNGYSFEVSNNPNYTFTNVDDGNYTIYSYAEDEAGNKSNRQTQQVSIEYHVVYAILYNDGTLVLNSNGNVNEDKVILQNYGKLPSNDSYFNDFPWNNDGNSINITNIEIENIIRPNYTSYWFFNLSNLANIQNIEKIDTSSVRNMQYMFSNCTSLSTLDLSNWDTSNVTNMYGMFQGCSNLTTLDVSTWNTANVYNMSYMFFNIPNLSVLDVSNWNTSNVTNMLGIFALDSSLETLNISRWNTSKVTNMSAMFSGLNSLTSLDIGNIDTSKVTSMNSMFSGLSSLTTLDVSKLDTSNVTDMGYMFSSLPNITNFDISKLNTSKVTNMSGMFADSNLLAIDLSHFDTSKVTNMSWMFNNSSFTNLDLSSWDTSNVVDMSNMFSNYVSTSHLSYLNISNWNTSNVTNMNGIFYNARMLESLDISKWDTRKVTNFTDMFFNTSANATSKVWYYGPNSTNLYDNRTTASASYITFEYKSN